MEATKADVIVLGGGPGGYAAAFYAADKGKKVILVGLPGAIGFLLLIFAASHALRLGGGRLRRALRRARTFLALRSDGALQQRLIAEFDALVAQSVSLERALLQETPARPFQALSEGV